MWGEVAKNLAITYVFKSRNQLASAWVGQPCFIILCIIIITVELVILFCTSYMQDAVDS